MLREDWVYDCGCIAQVLLSQMSFVVLERQISSLLGCPGTCNILVYYKTLLV